MRITTPYSTTLTPYRPNLDSSLDKRFEHFQSFRSALQAGDLGATQRAFPAFQKDMVNRLENYPSGGTDGQHKQAIVDLQKLGESLGAGDISAARQAFAVLKQDLQAFYSGAGSVRSEGSGAAPSVPSTPEPRGTVLNVYA
jgi:hypothetical protein